jgi:hypothetical protein
MRICLGGVRSGRLSAAPCRADSAEPSFVQFERVVNRAVAGATSDP